MSRQLHACRRRLAGPREVSEEREEGFFCRFWDDPCRLDSVERRDNPARLAAFRECGERLDLNGRWNLDDTPIAPSRHAERQHKSDGRVDQTIERKAFVNRCHWRPEKVSFNQRAGVKRRIFECPDNSWLRTGITARRPLHTPAGPREQPPWRRDKSGHIPILTDLQGNHALSAISAFDVIKQGAPSLGM